VAIAKSAPITVTSAATVTATPATVAGGDATTVTFAGGPGNRSDWWGVYRVGAPDTAYLSWGYLNGLQTIPATGLSGATLSIAMPGVPGTYEIRWWANGSLQLIAKSGQIAVTSAAAVSATPSDVNAGDSITATFTNGPAKTGDWWGVYLIGDPDTAYKSWGYLNGLHTMPPSGVSGAALPIAMPLLQGAYELRWFENNSLTRVATSGQIVVTSSP